MAWSNLANLFRGFSHDFCQLYNIKQIDFIFLCSCTVIDHRWRHSVWRTKSHALDCVSCVLFCSSHAMTSSVIYYSTDARKNEIYLLNSSYVTYLSTHAVNWKKSYCSHFCPFSRRAISTLPRVHFGWRIFVILMHVALVKMTDFLRFFLDRQVVSRKSPWLESVYSYLLPDKFCFQISCLWYWFHTRGARVPSSYFNNRFWDF